MHSGRSRNNHDTYYVYSGTRSERVPGNTLERVSERILERVRNAFFVKLFPDSTVKTVFSCPKHRMITAKITFWHFAHFLTKL